MANVYLAVLAVLWVGVLACCFWTVKKKNEYSKAILRLLIAGMFTMIFYGLFLMSKTRNQAMLTEGLYFIGTDWIVLCLMSYVFQFTESKIHTKLYRDLFLMLGWIDTVSMIINTKTEHVFSLESAVHDGIGVTYWKPTFYLMEYVHLGFCYGLGLITLIVLIKKTVQTSRFYRKMYLSVLVPLIVTLALNCLSLVIEYPVDFSVLIYTIYGFVICYYAMYSIPRGVVEGMLKTVAEKSTGGIVCYDVRGKCLFANQKSRDFLKGQYKDETVALERLFRNWRNENPRQIRDYENWEEQIKIEDKEYHLHTEYQCLRDEKKVAIGYVFRMVDRTEEFMRVRDERYHATHDRLTGLFNREYFFQKAEEILQRKPDVERYMICTKIRDLKQINELFGEEMGDRILIDQAVMLSFANYEDCIQGRIEGDEFAMLIAKADFKVNLAEENTGKLEYMVKGSNYTAQIGIGVYSIEDNLDDPRTMYEKAGMAIKFKDDKQGKRVNFYQQDMLKQMRAEKRLVSEFEQAVEMGQFVMHLQPIIGADGLVKGAEALARWNHPSRGLIMPADFISLVEQSGTIYRLDVYIWELAARKLKFWKNMGREDLFISVNIATKDFYYTDIYGVLTGLVQKYDINPANLKLEITETALMTDSELHIKTIQDLCEFGFCVSLDGFGRGYSSLGLLKEIDADGVKIDRLFLQETENQEKSRVILQSIIDMANSLGIKVVAEGVETLSQVDSLSRMGCGFFQGYYYSKPIPDKEFEKKYLVEHEVGIVGKRS